MRAFIVPNGCSTVFHCCGDNRTLRRNDTHETIVPRDVRSQYRRQDATFKLDLVKR
jgi:hypothetical protein